MRKKIIFTGGTGRFASEFKKIKNNFTVFYPNKKQLNILKFSSIISFIKKKKPNYLIHCAGLSRPMSIHDENIEKSIDLNIVGTANIVKACAKFNLKLIYFSTGYVYPGKKGNYKETDPVKPFNKYAWSKLGGESSVMLYDNSLILRLIMCEKPFNHKTAFHDIYTNFIFHEKIVKIIPKLLNKKGILNVGGKIQSVYNFAKKSNPKIKKNSGKNYFPENISMNTNNLKKILRKKFD
ncbi:sugar nucleotide-binding protein [Pelagibacteraceae bacterium]|jgi:dTDP-4-dehydrorhamnose reductase|nr:sugar nucleotide-binding protein [Pelagibacteraceae bacterium]